MWNVDETGASTAFKVSIADDVARYGSVAPAGDTGPLRMRIAHTTYRKFVPNRVPAIHDGQIQLVSQKQRARFQVVFKTFSREPQKVFCAYHAHCRRYIGY